MSQAADEAEARLPPAAVAGLLVTLAGAAALVKARSYDLWWHLETGEQILRTWSIPRIDDFTFTSRGAPWIDHEWLFQVLLYLSHALAGPWGLTLLKAMCAFSVAAICYTALRRAGAKQGTALGIAGVAILGLRFRLAERPEMVTLPMAAGFTAILLSLVAAPARPARRLLAAAAVTAVWANLHAGALLAPVIAVAIAFGSWVDQTRSDDRAGRPMRREGCLNAMAAALVSAVCLCLNPFGWRIYMVPSGISEALSPGNLVNPEWSAPTPAGFPLFFAAAAAAAAAAVISIARRRPLAVTRAAALLPIAALAFTSVRHIGVFFAVAPLALDTGGPMRWSWINRTAQTAGMAIVLGVTTWMLLVPPPGAQTGAGIAAGRFPEKAADFLDARLDDARLYNDVSTGGYLIWRGYPRRRVFIDGRNEVHAALLKDLSESIDDGRRWQALLDRHEVEGAVVIYRDEAVAVRDPVTGTVGSSTFSELHFPRSAWSLVYWDDLAMVFVRRDGRHRSLAERLEYRHCRPEAWRRESPERGIVAAAAGVEDEIRRKLAEDAGCALANRMARVYGVTVRTPTR